MCSKLNTELGKMNGLLLMMSDVNFLSHDELIQNNGVMRYRIFAHCVRTRAIYAHRRDQLVKLENS